MALITTWGNPGARKLLLPQTFRYMYGDFLRYIVFRSGAVFYKMPLFCFVLFDLEKEMLKMKYFELEDEYH